MKLEIAGKYSELPRATAVGSPARVVESARRGLPAARPPAKARLPKEAQGHRVPVLSRPLTLEEAVGQASDQVDKARADAIAGRGVKLFIPRFRRSLSLGDWKWRELREGGLLKEMLRREKACTSKRWRAVGKARQGFQQNGRSDLRLLASVPARDFFRFKRMDPDFFDDKANLRSLRRDNPEIDTIYV